jgi:hypothetical protein
MTNSSGPQDTLVVPLNYARYTVVSKGNRYFRCPCTMRNVENVIER